MLTDCIHGLASLLKDILKAVNDHGKRTWLTRLANASDTKRVIIRLEKRLQFFVNSYLVCAIRSLNLKPVDTHLMAHQVEAATHTAEINVEAFSKPISVPEFRDSSAVFDADRWSVISHLGADSRLQQISRVQMSDVNSGTNISC